MYVVAFLGGMVGFVSEFFNDGRVLTEDGMIVSPTVVISVVRVA